MSAPVVACQAAEHLHDVVGISLAIRRRFNADAVYASLTEDAKLSVVFSDDRRSAGTASSVRSLADSIAAFALDWFGKKRLSAVAVTLTNLSIPEARQQEAAGTVFHFVFAPEYEPDGSVRIMRIDAAPSPRPEPSRVR